MSAFTHSPFHIKVLTAFASFGTRRASPSYKINSHFALLAVSGAAIIHQVLSKPLVSALLDAKYKTGVSLINFMAAASQALITFCLWHSFKAHMDEASNRYVRVSFTVMMYIMIKHALDRLNVRGTATLGIQEDPEAAEESHKDSFLDPFLLVTAPRTFSEDDPFMSYIQDVRRPAPVLDLHPVESRLNERVADIRGDLPFGKRDGTKEIRVEWGPAQNESEVISPPENESSRRQPPRLAPNRLSEGGNTGSVPSKERKRNLSSPGERTDVGDTHPQLIRQLPEVPGKQ
ncbi:hypothetical protein AAF712_014168 [Marasmius tenuissimus]|uniref:DUF4149 domain-containing protein n=1 Tax=Marasmius tenuissimus TaxID=585030 RepID=A0ABR2ZD26_9AGAR